MKSLAQDRLASKWPSQDFDPGLSDPRLSISNCFDLHVPTSRQVTLTCSLPRSSLIHGE